MIIYFSGTGNSKYVADMLSEQLNDQSIDAGKMIKSGIKGEFESKHPWVFVAPTYSWQLPHVFEKFIKESTFKGAKTAYFIMTCGGDIGNAQSQIINICNEIDLEYLFNHTGTDAIGQMKRLLNAKDETVVKRVKEYLLQEKEDLQDTETSWQETNLSEIKAKEELINIQ